MSLGLRRGIVRLETHTADWVRAFERERERIAEALGDIMLGIEHVGSIAGLLAKTDARFERG